MKKTSFIPRIIKSDGCYIFVGPCKKCPTSIDPWIKQFCSLPENEWYVSLELSWADDTFNHYGIPEQILNYDLAMNMITDHHDNNWCFLNDDEINIISKNAKNLYGLLHSRYICQTEGLRDIKKKFTNGLYGFCPRTMCNNEKLLPIGLSHKLFKHNIKLFCPQCYEIYKPKKNIKIDGAHFGPAFPHIFLSSYPQFDSFKNLKNIEFTLLGFKISPFSQKFKSIHKKEKKKKNRS